MYIDMYVISLVSFLDREEPHALELKLGKVLFHLQSAHEQKVPLSTLNEMCY